MASCGVRSRWARRPTGSLLTRRRASARSPSWLRRRSPTSMRGLGSRSRARASSRPPPTPAEGSSATSTTAPPARLARPAAAPRRRIERDLHDGAQQRLVAVALSLQLAARSAEPATATALQTCIEDLYTALAELRELARGLHPAVLTDRGVPAALQALAARSPVPVVLDADFDRRLPAAHEAALYFVAAEAL